VFDCTTPAPLYLSNTTAMLQLKIITKNNLQLITLYLFSYDIIETKSETNSYRHANRMQDIFITDYYFKAPFTKIAIQKGPMRRRILNE